MNAFDESASTAANAPTGPEDATTPPVPAYRPGDLPSDDNAIAPSSGVADAPLTHGGDEGGQAGRAGQPAQASASPALPADGAAGAPVPAPSSGGAAEDAAPLGAPGDAAPIGRNLDAAPIKGQGGQL